METQSGVTEAAPSPYNRVLLKLSGEVFGGGRVGVDPDVVRDIAAQIADVVHTGVQVSVVVGGGNFFRGAELQKRGMDRTRADYMGMLGIVMNCLALQDFLEKAGRQTRVQTAITMGQVAEPYVPRRAIRHLEKGRVVIFGAGVGVPFFSTDTVAAQRALEIALRRRADRQERRRRGLQRRPAQGPDGQLLEHVTYSKALRQRLKVVDAAAFASAQENKLPMVVFGMEGEGILRASAVRRSAPVDRRRR